MIQKPDWLPEMLILYPWTKDAYDILYEKFQSDFILSQPHYRGFVVWIFPEKKDGKETIFWHLITRNDRRTGKRLPDVQRSARLPWVRPMIECPDETEIVDWDYLEGDGDIHTYIWLKEYNFVVIMKKYKDGRRRLITAHYIDYSNKKKKLASKYEKRI